MDQGALEPGSFAFWLPSHVHACARSCAGAGSTCVGHAPSRGGLGNPSSSFGASKGSGLEHGAGLAELGFGIDWGSDFGAWRVGSRQGSGPRRIAWCGGLHWSACLAWRIEWLSPLEGCGVRTFGLPRSRGALGRDAPGGHHAARDGLEFVELGGDRDSHGGGDVACLDVGAAVGQVFGMGGGRDHGANATEA